MKRVTKISLIVLGVFLLVALAAVQPLILLQVNKDNPETAASMGYLYRIIYA